MKKSITSAYALKAACVLIFFASCTFDYGDTGGAENTLPDLVMQNVEYVRVRSADPVARIRAERVERYEVQGLMRLDNFTFEQYGDSGESVNVTGSAGFASVEIESGDFIMDNGVWLEVESEDIMIETFQINWNDKERAMSSGAEDIVNIFQENGTAITGTGLRANARSRTWEFSGPVSGTYIYEENDEEEPQAR